MTDEEMAGAAPAPRTLTDEEMAAGDPAAPVAAPPSKQPGFFSRAATSIAHGIHAVGHVGRDLVTHPLDTLADPSKRRELERGVDDVVTLGYGQRLAKHVDQAWGDNKFTDEQAAADAKAAPEYRTAGNIAGAALPNPLSGALGIAGKGAAAIGERVAPKLIAKGLGYAAKVPGAVAAPAKALATYEANAVPMAALSAGAEGHRLEAAGDAATDPAGLVVSGLAGTVGAGVRHRVLNSKGGKARALIDSERSGGAHAGLLTPGKGGVFDEELKGLGTDDAATGAASLIGAEGVVGHLENQHQAEHGYGYREGPDLVAKARADRVEAIRSGEASASEASRNARDDIKATNDEALLHAHGRAPELLDEIDHQHRVEASEPYRVLKEQIDNSPAAGTTRDASELLAAMHEAKWDLETPHDVRAKITEDIALLERYRDPVSGIIKIPERQLNGFRRNLSEQGKFGTTDAPRGHDAPLRRVANIARQMVDSGPYAPLNRLYAEGSAARETAREALGMKGRLGSNRAAEESSLKARMLRSIDNPTAFPGEVPPGADMSPFRQRIANAEQSRRNAADEARSSKQAALDSEAATGARVATGAEAAIPDRKLLGLNENIGQQGVDQNQVRIALDRQVGTSTTAGANRAKLGEFRAKHPSQGRNLDLPVLQNAKNDLAFRLKPRHGGLMARAAGDISPIAGIGLVAANHPIMAGLLGAAQNKTPIAGRVLYTPAKMINANRTASRAGRAVGANVGRQTDTAAMARALGVASPALGDKVKALIESKKMEQQQ